MRDGLTAKRLVVTGGSGFLGRVVCRKLQERGCREVLLIGIDRTFDFGGAVERRGRPFGRISGASLRSRTG